MYKLVFYVPDNFVDEVKEAVFAAGAGKIGNYEACCWQVLGTGQFRPLSGSSPAIGHEGMLEKVQEYRVEMVLETQNLKAVIAALKKAHPYEEPAYDVTLLVEV